MWGKSSLDKVNLTINMIHFEECHRPKDDFIISTSKVNIIRSKKVLIDSNFLLGAVEEGKDALAMIDEVLDVVLPKTLLENIMNELKGLTQLSGRKGRAARKALEIAVGMEVLPCVPTSSPDEAIVKLSEKGGFIVATNDSALRRELRARGVPVIYFKDGYLRVEGYVTI